MQIYTVADNIVPVHYQRLRARRVREAHRFYRINLPRDSAR